MRATSPSSVATEPPLRCKGMPFFFFALLLSPPPLVTSSASVAVAAAASERRFVEARGAFGEV